MSDQAHSNVKVPNRKTMGIEMIACHNLNSVSTREPAGFGAVAS